MQSGLLVFTDFVGIVAFALAGILAAENRKVDPVGVFVMAFTTAFGGGLVRDLIIDNRPMCASRICLGNAVHGGMCSIFDQAFSAVDASYNFCVVRCRRLRIFCCRGNFDIAHDGIALFACGSDGSVYRGVRRSSSGCFS